MRVFLLGATGFLGRALTLRLRRDGHTVLAWVRSLPRARTLLGSEADLVDAQEGPVAMQKAIATCDAVVNLAGASVADGRWSNKRKQELVDSRINTTQAVIDALQAVPKRPKTFINASAVGFYGLKPGKPVDENAAPGNDFLAQLCQRWEAAAGAAEALGLRVAYARFGVVLGHESGALAKMLPLFERGLGGNLGKGQQMMPWVHLHDVAEALVFALNHPTLRGPFNVVAPQAVNNATFTQALAQACGTKPFVPVPKAALRLAMGEAADAVLADVHVLPAALQAAGFAFAHGTLDDALTNLLQPHTVRIEACTDTTPAPTSVPGDTYVEKRRPGMLLRTHEVVPQGQDAVFGFFCRAENLGLLTPMSMALHATGRLPAVMQSGTAIDYGLKVAGVPMRWRTRIAAWEAPQLFIDSQERGPYRAWWHEHHFRPEGDGTHMEDRVFYAVGKGPFGSVAHAVSVKQQLERIFRHRASAIALRFGTRA